MDDTRREHNEVRDWGFVSRDVEPEARDWELNGRDAQLGGPRVICYVLIADVIVIATILWWILR